MKSLTVVFNEETNEVTIHGTLEVDLAAKFLIDTLSSKLIELLKAKEEPIS